MVVMRNQGSMHNGVRTSTILDADAYFVRQAMSTRCQRRGSMDSDEAARLERVGPSPLGWPLARDLAGYRGARSASVSALNAVTASVAPATATLRGGTYSES